MILYCRVVTTCLRAATHLALIITAVYLVTAIATVIIMVTAPVHRDTFAVGAPHLAL